MITCLFCDKKTNNKKYCSHFCVVKSLHQSYVIPTKIIYCKNCGIKKIVRIASTQKFCSHICVVKFLKPRLGTGISKDIKNCLLCGKKLTRRQEKYCSYLCANKVMGLKRKGNCDIKEKISSGLIKKWQDPKFKGENPPWNLNLTKEIDTRVDMWQNPEYVKAVMKARGIKPNKTELKLEKIVLSYGFKYIGDGRLVVSGKLPDYWNGDHKLIELYGDYWHKNDNPQIRIDLFKEYGYDTLVIWEHELKDELRVINKIKEFVKEV